MSKFIILSPEQHNNTRVITKYSPDFGDQVSSTVTFPTEFGNMQNEYPILFRKNPETGEFNSFAMLGFQADENLFLDTNGWSANYVPAAIAKGPFLIGFQNQEQLGKSAREPVMNIDIEDPRVSNTEGEKLFDDENNLTPYAQNIMKILSAIHQGVEYSKQMFAMYIENDLIEPVTIDVQFDNGEKVKLQGCYTIHEEKLKSLEGKALESMNKSGFLQAAYLVIASLGNIKTLITKKNKQLKNKPNT